MSHLQKDKDSELSFRWKHCSITQQPLQTPIVACGLGRLYSKDAVIEALLDRANLPETAQHIKSLKVSFRVANVSDAVKETPDETCKWNSLYMLVVTVIYSAQNLPSREFRTLSFQKKKIQEFS